ncbi:MAG: YdeI family protein [Thermoplasmatota archaeon]|nr:YdeI/OmpD-associated family protein [Halobacteriales archaeon]
MQPSPLLDVGADRRKWRAWLRRNHATASHVWLVYWRKSSGRVRITYDDAVEEALCFGWIDSQQKAVDEERFAQRFTPRRPGRPLSEMNRQRMRKLVANRKMTKAGIAAVGGVFDPAQAEKPLELQADVARALRANEAAWRIFGTLPESYKRIRIAYIESGRRHGPAEFAKRLRNFVHKTAQGKRFGYVRELVEDHGKPRPRRAPKSRSGR